MAQEQGITLLRLSNSVVLQATNAELNTIIAEAAAEAMAKLPAYPRPARRL